MEQSENKNFDSFFLLFFSATDCFLWKPTDNDPHLLKMNTKRSICDQFIRWYNTSKHGKEILKNVMSKKIWSKITSDPTQPMIIKQKR